MNYFVCSKIKELGLTALFQIIAMGQKTDDGQKNVLFIQTNIKVFNAIPSTFPRDDTGLGFE